MTSSLPTATVPVTVASTTTSLATTTTTSPLRTEQIVAVAKDGLVIEGEWSGTCWSGSSAMSDRSDAFRCMSDDVGSVHRLSVRRHELRPRPLQDPTGPLTVLHLEEPLPANASLASSEGGSWYVELEGGTVCGFVGGPTDALDDERLDYHCDDESWVIGHPQDRGDGVLQALVDADDEAPARWTPVRGSGAERPFVGVYASTARSMIDGGCRGTDRIEIIRDLTTGPPIVENPQRLAATLARTAAASSSTVPGRSHRRRRPQHIVVLEFAHRADADWCASDAYRQILPLGTENSVGTVFIVDGVGDGYRASDLIR